MKGSVCPVCFVEVRIPDEARAYRCENCGTLIDLSRRIPRPARRDGAARKDPLSSRIVKALLLGLLLIFIGLVIALVSGSQ